jgi:hypothetical protein
MRDSSVRENRGTTGGEASTPFFSSSARVICCARCILPYVPIQGGNDAGLDGFTEDLEGGRINLVCTTAKDVLRNLVRSPHNCRASMASKSSEIKGLRAFSFRAYRRNSGGIRAKIGLGVAPGWHWREKRAAYGQWNSAGGNRMTRKDPVSWGETRAPWKAERRRAFASGGSVTTDSSSLQPISLERDLAVSSQDTILTSLRRC